VSRSTGRGTTRKYSLDEYFFSSISTEEQAYWLGFLVADGSVRKDGWVEVCLSTIDRSHLELFQKHLNNDSKLYTHPNQPTTKLGFGGKDMARDLAKFGIVPNKTKSLSLTLDLVPEHLLHHFWRGVVDGDGSLCITGQGYPRVSLCGSKDVLLKFSNFCKRYTHFKATPRPCPRGANLWYFDIGGRTSATTIIELLYGDASVYLFRKHEAAKKILQSSAGQYRGHWSGLNKTDIDGGM